MLWLALARTVHIAASVLLAGLFGFKLVVLAPVALRHKRVDQFQLRFKSLWGRLALVAWLLVIFSAVAWFGFVAASISGAATPLDIDPGTLQTVLLETQFGHLWAFRLGCCLVLGILLFMGSHEVVSAVFAFAILASLAAAGHSGAVAGNVQPLPMIGDIGHLMAAALWPGGLVPLLIVLLQQYRAVDLGSKRFAADVVRRFSAVSLVVVGLLVATGLLNTYFIVGSPGALFTTDYGRLLLLKIALFILMLGLGAWNLLVLKPRLSRAATVENQAAAAATMSIQLLIRSVACEAFLATGVVLVVGFLGTTPPPMH
jgi:putative copper resistance protein D